MKIVIKIECCYDFNCSSCHGNGYYMEEYEDIISYEVFSDKEQK